MSKIETSEYNTIKSALVNRNLKQALYDKGKVIMDGVLLTLHGDEHRKRRKLEHKIFKRDFFKYYERELFPKTLNETIKPFLENGKADPCGVCMRMRFLFCQGRCAISVFASCRRRQQGAAPLAEPE